MSNRCICTKIDFYFPFFVLYLDFNGFTLSNKNCLITIGCLALETLKKGKKAALLRSFDHVITFKTPNDTLISIADVTVPKNPLIININSFFELKWVKTIFFYEEQNLLKVGHHELYLNSQQIFNPVEIYSIYKLENSMTKNTFDAIIKYANNVDKGMFRFIPYILFDNNIPEQISVFSKHLYVTTLELLSNIKEKNPEKTVKELKEMVGVGKGATPAGDDVIVGLLLFDYFFTKDKWLTHLLKKHMDLFDSTTDESRQMVLLSLEGLSSKHYLDFIECCAENKDQSELISCLDRIMSTGHSSGSDFLFGFTAGYICYLWKYKEEN